MKIIRNEKKNKCSHSTQRTQKGTSFFEPIDFVSIRIKSLTFVAGLCAGGSDFGSHGSHCKFESIQKHPKHKKDPTNPKDPKGPKKDPTYQIVLKTMTKYAKNPKGTKKGSKGPNDPKGHKKEPRFWSLLILYQFVLKV